MVQPRLSLWRGALAGAMVGLVICPIGAVLSELVNPSISFAAKGFLQLILARLIESVSIPVLKSVHVAVVPFASLIGFLAAAAQMLIWRKGCSTSDEKPNANHLIVEHGQTYSPHSSRSHSVVRESLSWILGVVLGLCLLIAVSRKCGFHPVIILEAVVPKSNQVAPTVYLRFRNLSPFEIHYLPCDLFLPAGKQKSITPTGNVVLIGGIGRDWSAQPGATMGDTIDVSAYWTFRESGQYKFVAVCTIQCNQIMKNANTHILDTELMSNPFTISVEVPKPK